MILALWPAISGISQQVPASLGGWGGDKEEKKKKRKPEEIIPIESVVSAASSKFRDEAISMALADEIMSRARARTKKLRADEEALLLML